MGEGLRKTGIDVLGDVLWGTHLCHFYQTKEDLIDILVPYFKAGLENNEFCVWVTSPPLAAKEAKAALKKAVDNLDEYVQKGQLELLDHSEWYTKSGKFEGDKVLQGWAEKYEQAIRKGFEGLRGAGNLPWFKKEDWGNLRSYEAAADDVITKNQVIAVCSYRLDKLGAAEVIDAVENHQSVLIKRDGRWEVIENPGHRRMQQAQRRSEERYRDLAETAPEVFFSISPEDGTLTSLNLAFEQITGWLRSEIVGKPLTSIIHHDDIPIALEKFAKALQGETSPPYELRFMSKSGKILVGEVVGKPRVEDGKVMEVFGFVRDITERKQAEELLATLANSSPIGLYIVQDGEFQYINPRFQQLMGYGNELLGRPALSFVFAEDREMVRENAVKMLKSQRFSPYEYRYVNKQGEAKWVLERVVSIQYQGKRATLGSFIDITERKRAEEALRQSEEKLRVMFQSVAEGIVVTDLEGNVLEANEAAARQGGYDNKEELIGLTSFQTISPKDLARAIEDAKRSLAKGYRGAGEYTLLKKDGTEFIGEVNSSFIKDASGNPVAIVAIIRDITERKRAEEVLRQSEEKYRTIFESTKEVVIVSAPDNRIVSANPAAAAILGYNSPQELVGMRGPELYANPGQRKAVQAALVSKGYIEDMELTLRRKDGTLVQVLGSSIIYRDQQGKPLRVESVWMDITERNRAEELIQWSYDIQSMINRILGLALQEASLEELLRRALDLVLSVSWLSLESVGSIFLVEDKPGVLVMKAQTGLARPVQKECALVPFGRCLCGRAASTRVIQFADCLDERHEIRYEGIVPHGHYCVPIVVGDEVLGVMNLYLGEGRRRDPRGEDLLRAVADVLAGIIRHRRMEKKVAEYQELNRLKSNILSTVSHELRTPLASIKGYSTMLLDYERRLRREEKRECLEAIDRATDRLTELVERLLDMSRLEAGIFRLAKQPSRIDQLIREAVADAQLRSPEHKVIAELEKKLPIWNVDGKRIRQVLDNLLENAIRYSNKGTEVVVRAKTKAEGLEISVSDQGVGIPAADIGKVFDPMYRLEERLGQDPRGLGLGLPLCKALVEAHGGWISIESVVGKGTTVHFTLPLAGQGGARASETC